MEVESELSGNLASLYEYMVRRLLLANVSNDVDAIVEVEGLLNNIADAWKQIGPNASSISG
ncbi:flagellar export chaperone FliS, partial [Enterobacter quasiroggenkampii]